MTCYIISYDLVKERDYEKLYGAIKSYDNWARITESTWAIITNKSAKEVRDNLVKSLDGDDKLIVIKSGEEAAWKNASCSNEWLKKNL